MDAIWYSSFFLAHLLGTVLVVLYLVLSRETLLEEFDVRVDLVVESLGHAVKFGD